MTDEQRAKRLHYHMYDTLEGIEDHATRIVDLEELVQDMWPAYCFAQSGYEVYLTDEQDCAIRQRVRELGIEVDA